MAWQPPSSDPVSAAWTPPAKDAPAGAPAAAPDHRLGPMASGVVRPILNGAAQTYGFLGPDELTTLYNLIPGAPKIEQPSHYWERQVDKFTTPPTTLTGESTEFIDTALFSAGLGNGVARMIGDTGSLLGRSLVRFLGGKEDAATARSKALVAANAAKAQADGYKLPPAYIGGPVSKTVQGLGSHAKVTREFAESNQETTDSLAKRALELNDANVLDQPTLDMLRQEAYGAYDKVRAIGNVQTDQQYLESVADAGQRFMGSGSFGGKYTFTSDELRAAIGHKGEGIPLPERSVSERAPNLDLSGDVSGAKAGANHAQTKLIKRLVPDESELEKVARAVAAEKSRFMQRQFTASDALAQIQQLRQAARVNLRTYNYEKNAIGATQRQIAQALEDQLTRAAQKQGNPDVLKSFMAARQLLAKIRVVSDAMGPNGHINALDLERLNTDQPGYLTGPLLKIAQAAKNFPKALAPVAKQGEEGPWSRVDFLLGGSGFVFHHPGVAGLSLVRPAVTAALKSKPVQRSMVRGLAPHAKGGARDVMRAIAAAEGRGVAIGAGSDAEQFEGTNDEQ